MSEEAARRSIAERLAEFYCRFAALPAAATADEAFEQLCQTLDGLKTS